jgi:fumarate hydratase subunit beta
MVERRYLYTPLTDDVVVSLRAGDRVYLSGTVLTARDAAHKRLVEILEKGEELPVDLRGQVIYYCGPTPPPPGKVIGSCGPTTSSRMDIYTPKLLSVGVKGMIGKGKRSEDVKDGLIKYKALYFGALGGAGALISKCVLKARVLAFEDLGPEAIYILEVKDMPLFVINDTYGGDLYVEGTSKYRI